jgi:hypothetical protein
MKKMHRTSYGLGGAQIFYALPGPAPGHLHKSTLSPVFWGPFMEVLLFSMTVTSLAIGDQLNLQHLGPSLGLKAPNI